MLFILFSYVMVTEIKGAISPPVADFITSAIRRAEKENAELLIITMDTPGGLDPSMRKITQSILNSKVPICVYVYPSGARAASAGVFILLSAHIAAMAEGTNVGAAHPVTLGKDTLSSTMKKKIENDAVAYIRSLAEKRKRNAEWAEEAVRKSISITANQALKLHVIDIIANSISQLLEKLDGQKVMINGKEKILSLKNVEIVELKRGWIEKILEILANPTVAYILLLIGIYGIIFELQNPGAIFPGVIGAISLILAFYSFHMLPVNFAGVFLVILAIIMFILEIKVTSYGVLTLGGIISFVLGSLLLFQTNVPFFKISAWVIAIATIITVLFFLIIIGFTVKTHLKKPVSGKEGLIGVEGIAKTDLAPEGMVFIRGEWWNAEAERGKIKKGEKIVVSKIEGLKLIVKKKGKK